MYMYQASCYKLKVRMCQHRVTYLNFFSFFTTVFWNKYVCVHFLGLPWRYHMKPELYLFRSDICLPQCKQQRLQSSHSAAMSMRLRMSFLKVNKKSLVIFHLGTFISKPLGMLSMYIHKRWAEKGGKETFKRASWLPKTSLWWPRFLMLQWVWSVHVRLGIWYNACPWVNLSRALALNRVKQAIMYYSQQ